MKFLHGKQVNETHKFPEHNPIFHVCTLERRRERWTFTHWALSNITTIANLFLWHRNSARQQKSNKYCVLIIIFFHQQLPYIMCCTLTYNRHKWSHTYIYLLAAIQWNATSETIIYFYFLSDNGINEWKIQLLISFLASARWFRLKFCFLHFFLSVRRAVSQQHRNITFLLSAWEKWGND